MPVPAGVGSGAVGAAAGAAADVGTDCRHTAAADIAEAGAVAVDVEGFAVVSASAPTFSPVTETYTEM